MSKSGSEISRRFQEPGGWLWGEFTNARGHSLRFGRLSLFKTPLAHIVYVEGLSEFAEKTFEIAKDFNDMACNFSVYDRYGQGKSGRYFEDEDKQHSDGIEHEVDDLIKYCRQSIPAGEPIVLLGHSTGGLIATMALKREPELFKAAILTAPLMGIENAIVRGRESYYAVLPMPVSLTNRYIPGGGPWKPRGDETSSLQPDDFASDPVRNKLVDQWMQANEDLRVGSPTIGWVREMCRSIRELRAPGFLEDIEQPVIIFTAETDCLVDNDPTFTTADRLPNAEHNHLEGAKHELWHETDEIRDNILLKARNFLKKVL